MSLSLENALKIKAGDLLLFSPTSAGIGSLRFYLTDFWMEYDERDNEHQLASRISKLRCRVIKTEQRENELIFYVCREGSNNVVAYHYSFS